MTAKRFFSFMVALSWLVFNVQNICQSVLQKRSRSSPVEKMLITLQQYLTQERQQTISWKAMPGKKGAPSRCAIGSTTTL